ncbi:ionic transporter y4hA [Polynucleobacter paneuropaeus]|uniref:calcium:proton antiporter n=1 Tax=Polynucleobacter paneuropaeus TaxID=2527775 RepID=UPI001BFDC753|nr:ionic transporter y4hA [Polynucleobacter paneuropaeus]QWD48044.1 ionic transporter y4hA [Polynucleobacter paneuropaeus]QWD52928.1 ionic transporter y4hA [Polynucleobacter paneuropaeus]QWD57840.1 ionic transporter y4hA [Polynucleobacter paneuropaeus]
MANLLSQTWFILFLGIALIGAVLGAVHHAEVVAHKTGEPFGTLILSISVTIIEVSLIISMMLTGHDGSEFIARDAVFATVMIVINGVIGLCIFMGGLTHHEMTFRNEGTNSALAVLTALATFILVMPIVTTSTPGPDFTKSQLAFAGIASFALYIAFLFFQTVSHRDYYLPKREDKKTDGNVHAQKPSNLKTSVSGLFLVLSLITVVGLAELLSPAIERGVAAAGAPKTIVGIAIALLVLLPEGFAAVRAARANRLQSSLNLALGSALASIGLTIPTVAAIAIFYNLDLSLGISTLNMTLMYLSFFIGALTLAIGRTTLLQGIVHIIIFLEYLFLSLVP